MAKPEGVLIYNCDPSQCRGYWHAGDEYTIPPLGAEGNPLWVTKETAAYLMSISQRADIGTRGWLTTDKKVFENCERQLKQTKTVVNLTDPGVTATPKGVYLNVQEMDDNGDLSEQKQAVNVQMAGFRKKRVAVATSTGPIVIDV